MKTTLDDISAAMTAADGRTPTEVIDAFLPDCPDTFAGRMIPLTAGHYLALAKLNHPFVHRNEEWDAAQLAIAMFCFTRPSREIFASIDGGTFEKDLFAFLEGVPAAEMEKAASGIFSHWKAAFSTAIPMKSPHAGAQKKTADSAGFSPMSPMPSQPFLGRWITRFTRFLWPSFSL